MLNRRNMLLSVAFAGLFPSVAQAGLRDKLKARRDALAAKESEGGGKQRPAKLTPSTVSYGPALLDIYAPEGARNLPVFMHVHGGGWKNGNRKYVQSKPEWFVEHGYVFVSIDYRMLPEAPVATQANDVEAAYKYVRANIAKFGGDPGRIAASGHSAGCHLTALTAFRGGLPGVKALVLCDVDVYDIQAQADKGALLDLHKYAFPDQSQWKALSPSTYVGSRAHPPTLIAYSRVRGHKESAATLAAKLRSAGTNVQLFDGSAYSHFSINRAFGIETGGFTGATMKFLASTMA